MKKHFITLPSLDVISWRPANWQCREVVLSLPCLHPYSTLKWFWVQCNKTISKWDKIYWFVRDRSENVTSFFEKFSLETLHLKMKVLLSNSENREHLENVWNVDCVLANHNKVQDTQANIKTKNLHVLLLLFAV